MFKKFAIALLIAASFNYANAGIFDGSKKGILIGGAVVMGGIAVHEFGKKHKCRTVFHPETGRPKLECDYTTPTANELPIEENKEDSLGFTEKRVNTTKILRKALNAEIAMSAAPGSQPPEDPEDCEAHHIVPQSEGRVWAKKYTDSAIDSLENCVSIDSAENGIWLPNNSNGTSGCVGSNHKKVHTKNYYNDISARLDDAKVLNGCDGVKNELKLIKNELLNGRLWK